VFGYPRDLGAHWELGEVLGAGSFGVVRSATATDGSGRLAAVKTVAKTPRRGPATPRTLLKLRSEVDAMAQLGPSLDAVALHAAYEDDASLHMVMELCSGGSVLERARAGRLTEAGVARVARATLRFLAQCHAKHIVFRDVKPDNFLFLTDADDSPVRATDFGLALRAPPPPGGSEPPALTSRTGTPVYMAPEVIRQSYTAKADVWSAGVLVYQLLTGRLPFWESVAGASLQDVWSAILNDPVDLGHPDLPAGAADLLKSLMERDPEKRASAAEALRHPWLHAEDTEEAASPSTTAAPLAKDVVQRLQRFATHGRLKQAVLRLIADDVAADVGKGEAAVNAAARLFDALDADRSGGVTVQEMVAGLKAEGYALTDFEVAKLVSRLDVDRDGAVDRGELLAAMLDWGRLQADAAWAGGGGRAFARLDRDGSGCVDLAELAWVARAAGNNGALAEAATLLREADADGDGRISRAEFFALLCEASGDDALDLYDARVAPGAAALRPLDDAVNGGGRGRAA